MSTTEVDHSTVGGGVEGVKVVQANEKVLDPKKEQGGIEEHECKLQSMCMIITG